MHATSTQALHPGMRRCCQIAHFCPLRPEAAWRERCKAAVPAAVTQRPRRLCRYTEHPHAYATRIRLHLITADYWLGVSSNAKSGRSRPRRRCRRQQGSKWPPQQHQLAALVRAAATCSNHSADPVPWPNERRISPIHAPRKVHATAHT